MRDIDPMAMHEEIEKRAYEIYLRRGGEDGRDLDDWFAAEQELAQERNQDSDSELSRSGSGQLSARRSTADNHEVLKFNAPCSMSSGWRSVSTSSARNRERRRSASTKEYSGKLFVSAPGIFRKFVWDPAASTRKSP
jgi:hypothetical protein